MDIVDIVEAGLWFMVGAVAWATMGEWMIRTIAHHRRR